ncbi:MAG: M15 family metallopeptidase, partial [Chloroflexota bacterium]|nr:M15 family metallopeptidase [Chloroflexota bacterium]
MRLRVRTYGNDGHHTGMRLTRRRALALSDLVPVLAHWRPALALAQVAGLSELVRGGIERDSGGAVTRVFELPPEIAREVLLRATRTDALPDHYAPNDLVDVGARGIPSAGRQLLRALVVDDTRALIDDAAVAGAELYVGSGFRSQAAQISIFAAQVARWGDAETAARYSAAPRHSHHQLGTTLDLTLSFRAFRGSEAPAWLRENAHRFGFVMPYTAAAAERTGYVDEPWHARWVGRALAARLNAAGYHDWTDTT